MTYEIKPLRWLRVAKYELRCKTAIGRCTILEPHGFTRSWIILYAEGNVDKDVWLNSEKTAKAFIQRLHDRQIKKWLRRKA